MSSNNLFCCTSNSSETLSTRSTLEKDAATLAHMVWSPSPVSLFYICCLPSFFVVSPSSHPCTIRGSKKSVFTYPVHGANVLMLCSYWLFKDNFILFCNMYHCSCKYTEFFSLFTSISKPCSKHGYMTQKNG